MPPGRLTKRPNDGDSPIDMFQGPKMKMARLDRGPEDFSSVVKSKLQSYTRTGQACDRCKVRKIKCDALPEGCSHCTNQSLECYVTDRVTGRTERRGYMQQLEREKADMVNRIRSLEKLLESNGVEVQPFQGPGATDAYQPGIAYDNMGRSMSEAMPKDQWSQFDSVWVKNGSSKPQNSHGSTYTRFALLESRPSDSYLGVSTSDNAPLSSMKGTSLSILGTTIDITSFNAPDIDEPAPDTPIGKPLYNKSLMAFLQTAMNINPPLENVELPSRQDAFTYAEWYFLMIFPFLPVLHKPTFIKLLTRIYDDPDFKPSMEQLVITHMVFATIYFQYGIRNPEETEKRAQLNDLSKKHYHWCSNKLFYLCAARTLEAVQALTMIALYTRSFPKPGCSSSVANFTFSKAIEMNLHRAAKITDGITTLDNELRKRTWWTILALVVTLNGRLGRPMPITLEEFDTEFPLAIPDDCLSEEGVLDPSRIGQCDFMVGLTGVKTVPLYMEMYSNIYSVRRDPKKYIDIVRSLEEGIRAIEESVPDELKMEKCKNGNPIFSLYTQAFCLEFRLCLRHPSVCMTDDPRFCAENTQVCEETARKLLEVVGHLLKVRCLDTTWYQLSVYVAAIFSTLVAHWERRYHTSPSEIATLREEMAMWLNIISEVGRLLGTGSNLTTEISNIIERTITWIEHDMNRKSGSPPNQQHIKHQSTSPYQASSSTNSSTPSDHHNSTSNGSAYYESANGSTPYPTLAYGDQSSATTTSGRVPADSNGSYDLGDSTQYMYASTANGSATVDHTSPAQNPLVAFASQATQHVVNAQGDDWRQSATDPQLMAAAAAAAQVQAQAGQSGNTWHSWAAAIADSQERYSANALLTLGAAAPRAGDAMAGHAADMSALGPTSSTSSHAGQWPLLLFHDGTGVSGA